MRFKRGQKIFGYVNEEGNWLEFQCWALEKMSPVELREWRFRYKDRVHLWKDTESAKIYFNSKTFSYYPGEKDITNATSGSITLSHMLREKVIAERKEATFSLRNLIIRKINEKNLITIKYKKVSVCKPIRIEDKKIIPDITIEFDEPADLALKWKGKLFIEVVETHGVDGENLSLYKQLGHGVIEIPCDDWFEKQVKDDTHDLGQAAEAMHKLIRNVYAKHPIRADLIVDPSSVEYRRSLTESHYKVKNEQLEKEVSNLKVAIETSQQKLETYYQKLKKAEYGLSKLNSQLEKARNANKNLYQLCEDLKHAIDSWNKKSWIGKLLKGFKVRKPR